ncbi:MAG: histidine kinase [Catalinimonas sp.]
MNSALLTSATVLATLAALALAFIALRQHHARRHATPARPQQNLGRRAQLEAMLETQERERAQLAAELHDNVGQVISAVHMNLDRLLKLQGEGATADAQRELFDETKQLTQACIGEIRHLIDHILPPMLVDFGLPEALRDMGKKVEARTGLPVSVEVPTQAERYARQVEIILYRVAQELVGNAVRHGRATRVNLYFEAAPTALRLRYTDDADSLTADLREAGVVLKSMEGRVQLLSGKLRAAPTPHGGMYVEVKVPVALPHSVG